MARPVRRPTRQARKPTSSWRSSATFSSACAAQYVTPPDEKSLVENAINGMLTSLDPHSSYLNPEAAKDMRVQTKGEFGGLGIEVTMENELVKVITPIDDTPAAKAGVRAGDFIAEIDGEEVRGLTLNDAVEKMRGLVNTPIKLTILREGADKPIEITDRARHHQGEGGQVPRRERRRLHEDHLLHREDLRRPRGGDRRRSRRKVPDDKLKGYVLDLRLNPGGLLDQAVSVSDTFLDRGEIVSTRGRDPKDISRFDSRPGDVIDGKPLIVLVNGGSASASEIVAGALQDHRRATVVGTQSFGKGSVQTIIPLAENGALRLTTALYYTPAGKSIQGKGITPDIKVEQPLPEDLQGRDVTRGESDLKGHIKGAEESDEGSGSAAYVPPDPKDDVQLNYALDLLRGVEDRSGLPAESGEGRDEPAVSVFSGRADGGRPLRSAVAAGTVRFRQFDSGPPAMRGNCLTATIKDIERPLGQTGVRKPRTARSFAMSGRTVGWRRCGRAGHRCLQRHRLSREAVPHAPVTVVADCRRKRWLNQAPSRRAPKPSAASGQSATGHRSSMSIPMSRLRGARRHHHPRSVGDRAEPARRASARQGA